ncbi:unnamed protein product, partial [Rhizoctonia solani]
DRLGTSTFVVVVGSLGGLSHGLLASVPALFRYGQRNRAVQTQLNVFRTGNCIRLGSPDDNSVFGDAPVRGCFVRNSSPPLVNWITANLISPRSIYHSESVYALQARARRNVGHTHHKTRIPWNIGLVRIIQLSHQRQLS